jgi:iron-sulfur cluster repair protein YtfE (RIC family)
MPDVHLVDVNSLAPADLCNYLEHKYYNNIRQSIQTVQHYVNDLENSSEGKADLLILLFIRLKDETQQMIRNDELIIFPLIRNDKGVRPCPARKLPIEMMRQMHQKIMQVLEKIRQLVNNYIVLSNWDAAFKICCNELYSLEQLLQQAIYIKENVLLHKIKDDFNGKCSGDCKKDKVKPVVD